MSTPFYFYFIKYTRVCKCVQVLLLPYPIHVCTCILYILYAIHNPLFVVHQQPRPLCHLSKMTKGIVKIFDGHDVCFGG